MKDEYTKDATKDVEDLHARETEKIAKESETSTKETREAKMGDADSVNSAL